MPLGGLMRGVNNRLGFFAVTPPYVDVAKIPGASIFPAPTFGNWLMDFFTLRIIYSTPNLLWLVITLVMYFLTPYQLGANSTAAQGPITVKYFRERLPLWTVVIMGYFAFFHISLYFLHVAKRPFIPNRRYRLDKVLHNMFYTFCGVVMWVAFENVFAFLWATGRLPYMSDADAFASWQGQVRFWLGLLLIPHWRDFHFYFVHRFSHFRPLCRFVHSLHHRNTDVEPFSGLSMHPIEHLYYYACVLPSIFLFLSPSSFLFNGVHFTLAPAASHSGFEDHWQADAFHYYHHRYFEMNYAGFGACYLDQFFGSFHLGWKEKQFPISVRDDAKASFNIVRHPPTLEYCLYMLLSCACLAAWVAGTTERDPLSDTTKMTLALTAGFGPAVIAVLWNMFTDGVGSTTKPFEKRPILETLLHVVVGTAFSAVPVAVACYWAL